MLMLAVQSLLLILAAFIAGAMIACFFRRVFFARDNEHPTTDPDGGRGSNSKRDETVTTTTIEKTTETRTVSATEASRFGRALTGASGALAATGLAASSDKEEDTVAVPAVPPMDSAVVEPNPESETVPIAEQDGDPSITVASSPAGVDFTAPRISDAGRIATDEEGDEPPAESLQVQPSTTDAEQSSLSQVADVAALRSVRSEGLIGSNVSSGEDNVFRLPTASGSDVDDLKRIRGIGVLIEKKLNAMGVRTYEQIANWTAGDVSRVSDTLDFKGRIERESWIEQARILTSGGFTEFSKRG